MKFQQKMIALFATIVSALLFLTYNFPALTVQADSLPEETAAQQDSVAVSAETSPQETAIPESETITAQSTITESVTTETMTEEMMAEEETLLLSQENPIIPEEESPILFDEESLPETTTVTEEDAPTQSDVTTLQKMAVIEETAELAFDACVEYSPLGYRVKGAFTEFPSDIIKIRPLCSQNGKIYQECDVEWDLMMIEAERIAETKRIICLNSNNEPLKSYLEGSLNRFYLKLRLFGSNGILYETQTVLIDRGAPQPIPEEITPYAIFASSMRVRETNPFYYYGRYQITVKETATPKEISSVLPDTLPIEVQFMKKGNAYATGIIDCPVTWKSLTLPSLTAGESVTIEDAAEEIIIPSGTLVRTPIGVFRLDEPLGIEDNFITDEVRLVLNIVSEKEKPTGVLTAENEGLAMAFHQKSTGAAAICIYTLSEADTKWTELPKTSELALLDAINAQPSTASSGYTFLLRNDEEPYRSYLAAKNEGSAPTPFFIGLNIKGGVYDGQQLILTWPGNYEIPQWLPKLGGAGGNESNAGAGNKGDSTPEGQRPNLPQNTNSKKEEQTSPLSPIQTQENITMENTAELLTQPDIEKEQTLENKQADAFIQPSVKTQAAIAQNCEENNLETDTAAVLQTDALTESTTVPETIPAAAKVSAALALSNQTEKTDYKLFLWIMAAAVIIIGIILHTRKSTGTPIGRIDQKSQNILHRFVRRK